MSENELLAAEEHAAENSGATGVSLPPAAPSQQADHNEEPASVLREIFDAYDGEGTGRVPLDMFETILGKLGKNGQEVADFMQAAQDVAAATGDNSLTFDEFERLFAELGGATQDANREATDAKVLEFLRILDEYRIKCENEGNYLEAARALQQLQTLQAQEEKRQQRAIRVRQLAERQDVHMAHSMQYADFNAAWDKYMDDYDKMAQMYIQQMTEKHAVNLLEYQKQLRNEIASKPPKWSRELLDWRRRQHIMARQKNYAEAQRIKKVADRLEEKERRAMEEAQLVVFARKEAKFRQQQQAELHALLKRIEGRRREHLKQRALDSKRLLQRNRNVQSVLESKQLMEMQRLQAEIKRTLHRRHSQQPPSTASPERSLYSSTVPSRRAKRRDLASSGPTLDSHQQLRASTSAGQARSGTAGSSDRYDDTLLPDILTPGALANT